MARVGRLVAVLAVGVIAASCAPGTSTSQEPLRVGAIATGSAQQEKQRYEKLAEQLEQKLGTPVELVTSTDYYAIAEALRGERIDVAFLGSLSYVLIESRVDIEPIAVGVDASGASGYFSYLITNKPDVIKRPDDVRGRRLALASKLSTSGYLFPLRALRQAGVDPGKDTTLSQGGNHAANVLAVASGQVDAAFVDSVEYISAVSSGKIDPTTAVKVWQSERITGSPIVIRKALPSERRDAVVNALLALRGTQDAPIGVEKSERLVPAHAEDYEPIRKLAAQAGLSVDDFRS
jgi:phosphonate transport system substrate-binding protein